jgi:hypothetical protein
MMMFYVQIIVYKVRAQLMPHAEHHLALYVLLYILYLEKNIPTLLLLLASRGLRIKELPCIMLTAAPVVNLPANPGFRDAKWPKAEEAWEYFFPDIKYIEAHRALDDAQHEALITKHEYKECEELSLFTSP